MERRNFVKATCLVTLPTLGILPLNLLTSACSKLDTQEPGQAFFLKLLRYNDKLIRYLLEHQNMDESSTYYGALPDNYAIYHPGGAATFIYRLLSGYFMQESRFYGNTDLIVPCIKAAEYLEKVQYEDGTFDLLTTNFNSPPDTAFIMEPVCVVLSVIGKNKDPRLDLEGMHELRNILKRITLKAGECLVTGGIHTPNHRWVVCRALARIHSLYPDERYIQRIDQWLAEGIDIDPDGQYTEKSTGIYSIVVDDSFITVARLLDKPELLEPVHKNLEMSWYYVHPSGEIVTGASGRQDRGTRVNISAYYFLYRSMAILDDNAFFGPILCQSPSPGIFSSTTGCMYLPLISLFRMTSSPSNSSDSLLNCPFPKKDALIRIASSTASPLWRLNTLWLSEKTVALVSPCLYLTRLECTNFFV